MTVKHARGFTTNYNCLVHFDFLSKLNFNGDIFYFVTSEGWDFVKGLCSSPKYIVNQGPDTISKSDEKVNIRDFIDVEDFYLEPLWWENSDATT